MASKLPGSILFACDRNTIRSPMAAAIMRHLAGGQVFVDSAGVEPDDTGPDGFAVAAMREIGLDIAAHHPKGFDDLGDDCVDLIVTFTPRAQDRAAVFTRTLACEVEYWPVAHPAEVSGSRDARLQAYRDVREALFSRIRARFPESGSPA